MEPITKVLVTGAGGAIGYHMLAHIMQNTTWVVLATDSFRHKGYFDRIQTLVDEHPEWLERITVVTHDLNAPFTARQIEKMGAVQYIINLASISDVQASIEDPIHTVRNNVELMLNMLELAKTLKPQAFLHFSTDETFGAAHKDSKGHDEWDPVIPSNPYSASKACQESLAIAWWRSYGVPVIITHTMNNFGETQAPSKYPAMIQTKIENNEVIKVHVSPDGEIGTRYYIHSRNAADAVLYILNNTKPYMHVAGAVDRPDKYNIVGDRQVDNLELVQTISRLMGKEAKVEQVSFHQHNPGHDAHYGLNGEKLATLGWTAPVSFEDSLQNTITWQRNNPEWI